MFIFSAIYTYELEFVFKILKMKAVTAFYADTEQLLGENTNNFNEHNFMLLEDVT